MRHLLALIAATLCLGAAPAPVDLAAVLADTPAPTLATYRIFRDPAGQEPNAGVTPYSLNTPLFTDYAEKQRYLYLPPGQAARYRAVGVIDLPVGAVLIKTFAYPADLRHPAKAMRLIETRLLIHKKRGWEAQTYVWNQNQTTAVLKRAGMRLQVQTVDRRGAPLSIDYAVPNTNQCKECHARSGALMPIGPKARNLNGTHAYPEGPENQIQHLQKAGLLKGAPALAKIPATANWDDLQAPLPDRARAYLDANCGHCHNPRGMASNSGLFLDWETRRLSQLGVGKRPVAAGRGSGGLEVDILPGRPDESILLYRMASLEPGIMMPELGRSLVHQEGLDLVREYLAKMQPVR